MPQVDGHSGAARSTGMDVGAQQVGTLYAKAILAAADSAGSTAQILSELDSVVQEVLDKHPDLERLLGSDMVSHDDKLGIIDRVFAGKLSPLLLNSFKVLSAHGRLGYVRAIHHTAREMYEQRQGRVRVIVETAHPLDGQSAVQITNQIREMIAAEPVLELKVNPDLIAGVILRVGDKVYDGSVASQLKELRQRIIDRSVHEIQSGRNRFSHSEGN